MSYRGTTGPNEAFAHMLTDLSARVGRMEKRQRWQGAIRGPFELSADGWSLSAGGSVTTVEGVAVEGGVWLVVAFCTWTDNGSTLGYQAKANAVKIVTDEPETLIPLGDMDVIAASLDGGRQRSTTFVGRVQFDAPFRVRFTASGKPAESASVANVRMSVLAFPG